MACNIINLIFSYINKSNIINRDIIIYKLNMLKILKHFYVYENLNLIQNTQGLMS